ncbi:hypothetical protein [Marinobacterium aestuariivivens]|uniref:Uncharacterized protein n=1 Tax=Marinobacterium aestuariivivens TaxID=1698799 RepID=A0ABW2A9D2_9GAMM
MEAIIEEYVQSVRTLRKETETWEAEKRHYLGRLDTITQEHEARGWWDKFRSSWSYREHVDELTDSIMAANRAMELARQKHVSKQQEVLTRLLDAAIEASPRKREIVEFERVYRAVKEIHEGNEKLVCLGKRALREIGEADSAVSSAQAMEVFDLASDNKGISTLSSISSISASSEMGDAKRAVETFARAVKAHRDRVEALSHDTSPEIIDLGLDMLDLNGRFDIGSIVSLISLSSADSALGEAKEQVHHLLGPIRDATRATAEKCQRDLEALRAAKLEVLLVAQQAIEDAGVAVAANKLLWRVVENHEMAMSASDDRIVVRQPLP